MLSEQDAIPSAMIKRQLKCWHLVSRLIILVILYYYGSESLEGFYLIIICYSPKLFFVLHGPTHAHFCGSSVLYLLHSMSQEVLIRQPGLVKELCSPTLWFQAAAITGSSFSCQYSSRARLSESQG